jgi:hypothetical protein
LAALQDCQVKDWVGKISQLTTLGKSDNVALSVEIKPGFLTSVNVETDDIEPSSSLYQQVFPLKVGQTVKFSGVFLQDDSNGVQERSLTLYGSITDPEFTIQFSNISTE